MKLLTHLTTARSQKLEETLCVLTENFLSDSTGDMLLGPAVLRAAFGTCEREGRPLFPSVFPELREFLRKVKAVWCHKLLFLFCKRKMDYYVPLLALSSPSRVSHSNLPPCTAVEKPQC